MNDSRKKLMITMCFILLGFAILPWMKKNSPETAKPNSSPNGVSSHREAATEVSPLVLAESLPDTSTEKADSPSAAEKEVSIEAAREQLFLVLFKKLPRKSDAAIRKNSHNRKAFLEGATELAELSNWLERHPDGQGQALAFYKKCADDETLLTSFRALCVHKADRLSRFLTGDGWKPSALTAQMEFLIRQMSTMN